MDAARLDGHTSIDIRIYRFTIHLGSALHRGKGSYTVEIELLIRKGNSMQIYRIIAFLKYKIFQTLI